MIRLACHRESWGLTERPQNGRNGIIRPFSFFSDIKLASVLELGEVGVKIEVPLLRLREHLLQHEHVGVRRVDEFGIDLGGDDVADVGQHIPYFIVRVGIFHQPIVVHERLWFGCCAIITTLEVPYKCQSNGHAC